MKLYSVVSVENQLLFVKTRAEVVSDVSHSHALPGDLRAHASANRARAGSRYVTTASLANVRNYKQARGLGNTAGHSV